MSKELIRKEIRRIIEERVFGQQASPAVNNGLEKAKTEELLNAFVQNKTSNNLVEIRYEGQYSPLKSADVEFFKGSVDVYFLFNNYQGIISASFNIDNKNAASNLITLKTFYGEPTQGEGQKVDGFDDFASLDDNLNGKATRKVEVLIQQKISIDKS